MPIHRQLLFHALLYAALLVAGCTQQESAEETSGAGQLVQEQAPEKPASQETPVLKDEDNEATKPESPAADSAVWKQAPSLPGSMQETIEYPAGRFSGVDDIFEHSEASAFFSQLPALPEDASEEDVKAFFTYIYSLTKPEYPDPLNIRGNYAEGQLPGGAVPAELQKDAYNVEIVLDASGSMANKLDSRSRMELAKEAIQDFVSSLPEEAKVGLRVYGHQGTGSDADKELSCSANELIYNIKPYEPSALDRALDGLQPAGWTPLAKAIELAGQDLAPFSGETNRNVIFIVSDGIETCGGDPVQAAKQLKSSNIMPIVNIIGFDVDSEGQAQLKAVAEAAGGTYADVKSRDQLKEQFGQQREEAKQWLNWYYESRGQALEARGDHYDQIMAWRSACRDLMHTHFRGQLSSISFLLRNDKINGEQRNQMMDLYSETRKRQIDQYGETSDQLFELKDLQFEEAKKRIEDMFRSNRP